MICVPLYGNMENRVWRMEMMENINEVTRAICHMTIHAIMT